MYADRPEVRLVMLAVRRAGEPHTRVVARLTFGVQPLVEVRRQPGPNFEPATSAVFSSHVAMRH
jgi:hypothetical protein